MYEFEVDGTFLKMMEFLSELHDEIGFKIEEKGIKVSQTDRAMICMTDFFYETKVKGNKEKLKKGIDFCITTNVPLFKSMGNCFKILVDEATETITLKEGKKEFIIKTLNYKSADISAIDNLEFEVKKDINFIDFLSVIKSAEIVDESMTFEITHKGLELTADDDITKFRQLIELNGLSKFKDKKIKSRYSIDYLKKLSRLKTEFSKCRLELNTDYPIKITFLNGGDFGQKKLSGFVVIAPRVDS